MTSNCDVLVEKATRVQKNLRRIQDTVQGDLARLDLLDIQEITTLNLQRAIQLSIDMAFYLVSSKFLGIPQSFADVFCVLERNRVIEPALSSKMQKMVGFRNIAVHDYQTIDPTILKKIVSSHLKDLEEFYDVILRSSKAP